MNYLIFIEWRKYYIRPEQIAYIEVNSGMISINFSGDCAIDEHFATEDECKKALAELFDRIDSAARYARGEA